MPKKKLASDEEIIQAVQTLGQQGGVTNQWVTPEDIITFLGTQEDILERLQQLAAVGKLQITYAWRTFSHTAIKGVDPTSIVGYCKDSPRFRVP